MDEMTEINSDNMPGDTLSLFDLAEREARGAFGNGKEELPPVIICEKRKGERICIGYNPMPTAEERRAVALVMGEQFRAWDVVEFVVVNEAWAATGWTVPSQDPNRKEVLVLTHHTPTQTRIRMFDIKRAGSFRYLGQCEETKPADGSVGTWDGLLAETTQPAVH